MPLEILVHPYPDENDRHFTARRLAILGNNLRFFGDIAPSRTDVLDAMSWLDDSDIKDCFTRLSGSTLSTDEKILLIAAAVHSQREHKIQADDDSLTRERLRRSAVRVEGLLHILNDKHLILQFLDAKDHLAFPKVR